MKKLLLAAMGATLFASLASATNVSYIVSNCYSYGLTAGAAPSLATGSGSGLTSFSCATAASLGISGLNTQVSEFLVYNNDWNGLRSASATTQTAYTFAGAALNALSDTLTSGTNGGTSAQATTLSSNGFNTFFPGGTFTFGGNTYIGASVIDAGFYNNSTDSGQPITGTYNTQLTAGNVQGISSYVDIVYGYTTSPAPEPSSLLMMGSALLGLGALKFRKRS